MSNKTDQDEESKQNGSISENLLVKYVTDTIVKIKESKLHCSVEQIFQCLKYDYSSDEKVAQLTEKGLVKILDSFTREGVLSKRVRFNPLLTDEFSKIFLLPTSELSMKTDHPSTMPLNALLKLMMKSLSSLNHQVISAASNPEASEANEKIATLEEICEFLKSKFTFRLDTPTENNFSNLKIKQSDNNTDISNSNKINNVTEEDVTKRLSECVTYVLRKNNLKIFIRVVKDDVVGFKLNEGYIHQKLVMQNKITSNEHINNDSDKNDSNKSVKTGEAPKDANTNNTMSNEKTEETGSPTSIFSINFDSASVNGDKKFEASTVKRKKNKCEKRSESVKRLFVILLG